MADTDELGKRRKRGKPAKWIAGAVKHPGMETMMAHKAGMGVQEYAEEHAKDKGKSGQRARFAMRMKALSRRKK